MSRETTKATKGHHSLVFCETCGTLLDPPASGGHFERITCRLCGSTVSSSVFDDLEVVTHSRPDAFPDVPPSRRVVGSKAATSGKKDDNAMKDGATIKEKCPKCEAPEMVFHTAQLRSADEGQTVFYSCVKCGYKFSINS
ncbi:transcription factor S-II-domain-containing protein [Zopfochytrium polystomum]|nr:transcription factor S-II-domain-containing protein [Zopfochytrium polystomum]